MCIYFIIILFTGEMYRQTHNSLSLCVQSGIFLNSSFCTFVLLCGHCCADDSTEDSFHIARAESFSVVRSFLDNNNHKRKRLQKKGRIVGTGRQRTSLFSSLQKLHGGPASTRNLTQNKIGSYFRGLSKSALRRFLSFSPSTHSQPP